LVADGGFWFVQILNSLQLSMLLFLLSVGLSVIFGLLNFVNLAHGSLYALGAFIGYSIAEATGSVWAAFFLAPIGVTAIGAILYVTLIDRLRNAGPMNQVLVTFGLIFVIFDLTRYLWGVDALGVSAGVPFSGRVTLFGETYPAYRLFIVVLGFAIYLLLHLLLEHTRIGAEVRAGVDDAEVARCLGIDVGRSFLLVFLLGCALAGLAGAVAMPAFSATPGMGVSILVPTLVVVVVGGLGSLRGALIGSLLIGTTLTFGQVLMPQFAGIVMYALLVLVLLVKPSGLFPVRS